jgi:hypothetical protein
MTTADATADSPVTGTPDPAQATRHRRWVLGARTALIMLLVAGVALVGIGIAALLLVDPPDTDGWMRSLFGRVFGAVAIVIGLTIGIPASLGVWAMSGATADGATPALSRGVHQVTTGIAVVTLVLAALVVLIAGPGLRLLDVALIGIVALPTLGLAGAVRFSPHRGRAIGAALALIVLAVAIGWLLLQTWLLVRR